MTVLNGGGSGRDKVSRLKGVEPLELVQSARGREAEERKPIARRVLKTLVLPPYAHRERGEMTK
jgi:hypothetical protein